MDDKKDLELLLKGRTSLLVIETAEEKRIVQMITDLGLSIRRPLYQWSVTEGLSRLEFEGPAHEDLADPVELLRYIKEGNCKGVVVLPDFHPYLEEPVTVRLIKEIALNHAELGVTLVFISHSFETPPEIKIHVSRFEPSLPDSATLEDIVREEARQWSRENLGGTVKTDRESLDQLLRNLAGLTAVDARKLIRNAIENDGAITEEDMPEVLQAKYRLLDRDGALSFEYDTAKFSEVGGLRNLKKWLKIRTDVFLGNDKSLEPPKGILLVGVQGGGKSLAAKSVAGMWGLPLLRLEMGALYDKFIGETEKNLREAIKTAEVMAPCVLWIDEIEKAVSGDSGGDTTGTSRRMLGTLLTWMAEKKQSIFIVATANEIDRLPPELIRKGRLDEIFFVDLPEEDVREEIFAIHINKRDKDANTFDLKRLGKISTGFTGAEIEQAVVSALYLAKEREEDLNTEHLAEEISKTRPLSVVMAEKVAHLRAWATERTVSADK